MKHRYTLLLLIILSVLQVATVINFTTLDALFIGDDHPKFFSYSVENAKLLLDYGSPFGFNHDFQGGIPSLYLRSCFLELIPFALLFGYPMGYQIMLILFLALIPLSFFYLLREWTGKEELAMIAAFLASFYTAGYYLKFGMTPAIAGYALSFLMLLFFSRYLASAKPYLLPLLLTAAILAYTHLVFFALTCCVCAIIAVIHWRTRPAVNTVRRAAGFAAILAIVLSDLGYRLFHLRSYLQLDYSCTPALGNQDRWGAFLYNGRELLFGLTSMDSHLLIAVLVLGICDRFVADRDQKRLIRGSLLISIIFILVGLLDDLTQVNIVIGRIDSFQPYVFLFDLALILWLPLVRHWQSISLPVATLILFLIYPFSNALLPTVGGMGDVDRDLGRMLRPGDFVLLENRAHICDVAGACDGADYPHEHWETYLQSSLRVKMMAHMGEDAQPYNTLRQMYIVNGRYLGKTLDEESGAGLVPLMAQWGVGKACVWSPAAIAFFQGNPSFAPLGKSRYYTCFQGTYPPVPDVATREKAEGRIVDVTPFSFRVHLSRVTKNDRVIINKNFSPFWSAHDQDGRSVKLGKEGQRISFEVNRDGDVFFEYPKNRALNLASLALLLLTGASDLLRLRSARRIGRGKGERSPSRSEG